MTHFTYEKNPSACLFGNRLVGTRNRELKPKNNRIKIHYFTCNVNVCGDSSCRDNAQEKYGEFGYDIHGETDDEMSGDRGFIQPFKGCDTPGWCSDASPKKGSKHDPVFSVNKVKNNPAVCFFDGWLTEKALLVRVQSKVELK